MEIESNDNINSAAAVERQRDRNRRADRGSRFSDADTGDNVRDRSRDMRGGGGNDKQSKSKRVYVSNIPYTYRWQELKDLFRRQVGPVDFAEIYLNENSKSRGCGIVEFADTADAERAVEVMHRYELESRQLVVRLDFEDREKQHNRSNRDIGGGGGGGGNNHGAGDRSRNTGGRDLHDDLRYSSGGRDYSNQSEQNHNTYGLSASFLNNLGIQPPLHNKIFIANLDYKVDASKLRQVFKLAGRVIDVDLSLDKDGKSRGFAVVEFDHPVEAVQAISMFDQQMLFDRRMKIRLDRILQDNEKQIEGLGGIGMGLGPFGEPLRNVAHNLPSLQNQNCVNNNASLSNAPNPVSAPLGANSLLGPVPNQNLTNNLAALNNVVGNLNNLNPLLTTLGLSNLANAANNNSDSLGSNLDMSGKNFIGGGGGNVGNNVGGLGGSGGNYGNLSQSNRHDSNLSNQYNSGLNNQSAGGNSGYSTNQRGLGGLGALSGLGDFDLSNVRGYNTQTDDYNRPSLNYQSSQSQLQNIIKNGSNVGSNAGGRNMSDTILIRNLPPSCTWQTLRDIFRDIGEVKFAEMRGQDSGVVRFSKERDAELAIKLKDGSRFDGRTIEIGFF